MSIIVIRVWRILLLIFLNMTFMFIRVVFRWWWFGILFLRRRTMLVSLGLSGIIRLLLLLKMVTWVRIVLRRMVRPTIFSGPIPLIGTRRRRFVLRLMVLWRLVTWRGVRLIILSGWWVIAVVMVRPTRTILFSSGLRRTWVGGIGMRPF